MISSMLAGVETLDLGIALGTIDGSGLFNCVR